MSDAMDLGAALAAKLRVEAGVQRAHLALEIVRTGLVRSGDGLRGLDALPVGQRAFGVGKGRAMQARANAESASLVKGGDGAAVGAPLSAARALPVEAHRPVSPPGALTQGGGGLPKIRLTMMDSGAAAARHTPDAGGDRALRKGAVVSRNDTSPTINVGVLRALTSGQAGETEARDRAARSAPVSPPAARMAQLTRAATTYQPKAGAQVTRNEAPAVPSAPGVSPPGENGGALARQRAPVAAPGRIRGVGAPAAAQAVQNGEVAGRGRAASAGGDGAALAGATEQTNGGPSQGDVYLDGTLMGRWMSRNLAAQASRPASGGAGFDPRRGVFPTGAMIGG